MQNIKFLFMSLLLVVGITACEKDTTTDDKTPVLKFERAEVAIVAEGTAVELAYEIENVAEGSTSMLAVTNDAEWLTIDTTTPNVVKFSATRNETNDVRSVEVVFGYEGAEDVTIVVLQAGDAALSNRSIEVEVTSVDSTMITFNVKASHDDLTWIPMVTYKEGWEEPVNEEEIYLYDLAYFEYLAEGAGATLEMFLEEMLGEGSEEGIVIERLDPETEYVVYVYGLSKSGERLTDIAWTTAKTKEAWTGDITFEFDITEKDFKLEYVVTPSHLGVDYYQGIAKESEIEAWKAAAGSDDLAAAIQYGDIEPTMKKLMDAGYIQERIQYYNIFNYYNVCDDGWAEVDADTKYILYAAKWNTDCEIIGAVSTAEYTTPRANLSDNVITLNITEITQSSVTVEMKTTNNDPYVVIPVKTSVLEGMTEKEIYAFIVDEYSVIVNEYTFSGNWSKTYGRMRPGTEYTILGFGHKAGVQTTDMIRIDITTPESGDPKDCTFDMLCVPADTNVWLQIIPSDKGHHYFYEVFPADHTADDAKAFIRYIIEEDYEGNLPAFSSWRLLQGDYVTTEEGLKPTTEYKLGVVIMNYDTGEFLSDMFFSDVFTTTEMTYADVSIEVKWDKYYDADELVAAGYTQYSGSAGMAIVPVYVELEGDYLEFYFAFYNRDLTDENTYPDDIFYQDIQNNGYRQKSLILDLPYDKEMTATGVIYDQSYHPGKVFRKAVTFTKEGVSPVSDYAADRQMAPMPASLVIAPDATVKPVGAQPVQSRDAELFACDEELEAAAERFVAEYRREEAKRIVESRRVVNEERRIAR